MYEILNDIFFTEFEKPAKTKIEYGGSGSGKSVSIAQYFISKLMSGDGKRRAVFRKSFPFMKLTTYLVLKAILFDWGVVYHENKTDHYFEIGKNRLYYLSLDESEKIKGGEFAEVWLEEASEFDEDDYKQLRLRLSRDKFSEDVQIFLSFNPVDENHWVVKLLDRARLHPDQFNIHHSTYHDNDIHLSATFINELEGLIDTDENFFNIYCLGVPGVLKNKIYDKFSIEDIDQWPTGLENAPHCYGLDFGYNHAMVLMEVWFYENELYFQELYYETEKTTEALYIWMNENMISHESFIYADSAEPDRIESLCESKNINGVEYKGFNVHPAKKDVKAGIDFMKGKTKHVSSDSINFIRELRNYKYKETKAGDVIDEPVKFLDDACFIAGTLITTIKGDIPIENIKVGDLVLTRKGYKEVYKCGVTSESSEVKTLVFENGKTLTGTRQHPIYVNGEGFVPLGMIGCGEYVLSGYYALRVVQLKNHDRKDKVYNLSVNDVPEYFANGVLVHNCDAARYGAFTAFYIKPKPKMDTDMDLVGLIVPVKRNR